ncbi:MAG: hypothetical protein GKS00_06110 [Alphaproteobacteria bacterium]|nr:hypothetical protein [Alphaproteobacteria bacterium]
MLLLTKFCRSFVRPTLFVFLSFGLTACLSNSRDPQYGAYPYHSELHDYYNGNKANDPALERELNYGWDIGP